MEREILFRGFDNVKNEWVYGDLIHLSNGYAIRKLEDDIMSFTRVDRNSIGQYTGVKDGNIKKIFEGDILRCYKIDSYFINPDCDFALQGYSGKIVMVELPVEYIFDGFCLDNETCYPIPISDCGLNEEDIIEIRKNIENDSYFDTNGYELDNTIVGIEIIGNVTDNTD